jgi:hypothetical protein
MHIKMKHLVKHRKTDFIIEKSRDEGDEGVTASPEGELSWRRRVASRSLPTKA